MKLHTCLSIKNSSNCYIFHYVRHKNDCNKENIPQALMVKFSSCISLSEGMGGGGMVVLKHVVQKIWFFGPQKSILSKSLPSILILQFSSKFFPTA